MNVWTLLSSTFIRSSHATCAPNEAGRTHARVRARKEVVVRNRELLQNMFGPLGLSLAPQLAKSRSLYSLLKPVADWYAQAAGYRRLGLKYDDLRKCPTCHPQITASQ